MKVAEFAIIAHVPGRVYIPPAEGRAVRQSILRDEHIAKLLDAIRLRIATHVPPDWEALVTVRRGNVEDTF